MSELSRRPRSGSEKHTVFCFCQTCDRVLYVDDGSLFCPVCSSVVVEVALGAESSMPEIWETPSA